VARSFLSGLVAHELPPPVAAQLLPTAVPGSDPVLRIVFTGTAAHDPIVADLVSVFGIQPNILHGRIDYVGDRPLGVLTLVAGGAGEKLPAVLSHLSSLGLVVEVIGHAVRSVVARRHSAAR
jgi:D-methionine transport system ATP-binding protein